MKAQAENIESAKPKPVRKTTTATKTTKSTPAYNDYKTTWEDLIGNINSTPKD